MKKLLQSVSLMSLVVGVSGEAVAMKQQKKASSSLASSSSSVHRAIRKGTFFSVSEDEKKRVIAGLAGYKATDEDVKKLTYDRVVSSFEGKGDDEVLTFTPVLISDKFLTSPAAWRDKYSRNELLILDAVVGDFNHVMKGLNAGADVNFQDKDGKTALHHMIGATDNVKQVLQLLINRGADVNITDRDDDTPFDSAVRYMNILRERKPEGYITKIAEVCVFMTELEKALQAKDAKSSKGSSSSSLAVNAK